MMGQINQMKVRARNSSGSNIKTLEDPELNKLETEDIQEPQLNKDHIIKVSRALNGLSLSKN